MVSHDPGRWNFSENTDLSEVLLIARKLDSTGAAPPAVKENVTCINLWKNPTTAVEALGVAHVVMGDAPPVIDQGQGALEITLGDTKFGEAIAMPWVQLRERSWIGPCAFAQVELLRVTQKLIKGNFILPGSSDAKMNPLCPLGQLGTLGPDRRDIHDGFSLSSRRTAYPAFWGHDASSMMTLAVTPNKYLSPLPRATKGHPLRKASDLWPRAGRVLIAERLWLKTQRLVSVYVDTPVLSNVWWPFNQGGENEGKPLAMWLNSTLGLLILWAEREETRGAWVDFKKPVLTGMPVLDLSALSSVQKDAMAAAYDQLCQSPLLPFPQMAQDPVRRDIDKAIAQVLALPDFSVLRDLLAQEPVVCLKPLS